ncbi:hypothetical protein D3C83_35870 [compost metagenome]
MLIGPQAAAPGKRLFAAGFVRSQSTNGLKVPLGLLQVRVTWFTVDCIGLTARAIVYDSPTT